MKGLILKDIINLKQQAKMYIIVMIFLGIVAVMNQNTGIFAGIIFVYATMMPITAMAYDEKANWDKYALTMPVSKQDIVIGKYAIGLIAGLTVSVITFLFSGFIEGFTLSALMSSAAILGVSIIFLSILQPIMFKFGVEKGRMLLIAVFMIPAILAFTVGRLDMVLPLERILTIMVYLFPIIAILFLGISILISIHIYKKKEL